MPTYTNVEPSTVAWVVPAAVAVSSAGAYLRWSRRMHRIVDPGQRDDWREVRAQALAIVERSGTGARLFGAPTFLGLSELVLGDLESARRWLETAAQDDEAPWHATAVRQLASLDRIEGRLDAARNRLEGWRPELSGDDRWATDMQHALIDLAEHRYLAAQQHLHAAMDQLESHRPIRQVTTRATNADLAQAKGLLAEARRHLGDLAGAAQALEAAERLNDGRPYVAGLLAIERSGLALALGDPPAAARHADAAIGLLAQVGARLDEARALAARGRARAAEGDRDAATTDLAEAAAVLRAAGARTYLRDVEASLAALAEGSG